MVDSNSIEEMSIVDGAETSNMIYKTWQPLQNCIFFIIQTNHTGSIIINRVTGAKDNIDEYALNEELDERLDDRLNRVK